MQDQAFIGTFEMDGNDLLLVFPPEVLDAMGAMSGDQIVWSIKDGVVTVSSVTGQEAQGSKE